MPPFKTPAIVLKSRKWGEADRIVTFFTLRFGKLRGIARGARRIKSRFGSSLEPFVHCDLNLFEKRGDSLYRVTGADIQDSFSSLREELSLMSAAARMANLVTAVTAEGDASPRVFDTLLSGLRILRDVGDPALTALLFQIKLLGETGFRPQTDHCAACGTRNGLAGKAPSSHFSAVAGGVVCGACARRDRDCCLSMSAGSQAFLQQALRWAPDTVARLKAAGQVRMEVEAAIESYVTVVTGKRLPAVDFLPQATILWGSQTLRYSDT